MSLSLGVSLPPDSVHALSVSLPKWEHVVGYEEGKREVLDALACGYPRFFVHPLVLELTQLLQTRAPFASLFQVASDSSERAWMLAVSPTRATAERLQAFLLATAANDATVEDVDALDVVVENVRDIVFAVRFPRRLAVTAKQLWQHSGEIVTSRHAELALRVLRDNDNSALEQLQMQHTATHAALRARIASLYPLGPSADDVFVYPTGMGAIFASVRLANRLRPGAKSVLIGFPYVDTLKILSRAEWCARGVYFFPTCGDTELAEVEAILAREPVLGVFTEFPGNPLLSTPDLKRLARLAHANGAVFVVDDTVGSYNVNVMQHGTADVVTTSLSKIFSGSCTVMGGSVVLSPQSALYATLKQHVTQDDAFIAEADARALLSDSTDVLARLERVNRTTSVIAQRLRAHPLVQSLFYPELQANETFTAFLTRPASPTESSSPQFGPLLSFVLTGGLTTAQAFYDAVDIAKGPSLGTNFTICCPYTLLAHYTELDFAESCGVDRHLLRVSIGLEDVEALWRVFEHALAASSAAASQA